MRPLHIDFAPSRPHARQRLRWFAGGAGALMLVVASAAWLLTSQAEAGRMGELPLRLLPDAEEAQAEDAAVRHLNFPWTEALAALESVCADPSGTRLIGIDADLALGSLRVTGEARNVETAQSLPERLRAQPAVADAVLLAQEKQPDTTALPVRFVLELRLREPS